ncbi:hypothetical protein [Streptomyces sp. NBC_01497]|uniref:hypothetical protein n=1 Tax=Streptomyces sp. NBC_01497 TaxID=2903885 RepID=UPI002E340214|nr:hypothetical protein [Streptomyces sp. NBC_01497]
MADAPPPPARRIPALVAAAAVLLVLLAAGTATAVDRPTQPKKLTLISTANGAALADAHGNPLYLREGDKPNKPGATGRCAALFPPAVGSPKRGHGVTGNVTHTPHHARGSDLPQVVYVRHPLYYYAKDHPKRPRGQNMEGCGFRLVAPDGSPLPTGEIGTATSRPEPPASRPARPHHTAAPRPPAKPHRTATPRPPAPSARGTAPRTHAAGAATSTPASRTGKHPHTPVTTAPGKGKGKGEGEGTNTRSAPPAPPSPARTRPPVDRPSAPATSRATGATTGRATPPATPGPTVPGRATTAAVGALQATPSGAASGGAAHPATATAADRARTAGAVGISLAVGACAAASAGALVVTRRLRRNATGGEH